jgi:hypothetical protein
MARGMSLSLELVLASNEQRSTAACSTAPARLAEARLLVAHLHAEALENLTPSTRQHRSLTAPSSPPNRFVRASSSSRRAPSGVDDVRRRFAGRPASGCPAPAFATAPPETRLSGETWPGLCPPVQPPTIDAGDAIWTTRVISTRPTAISPSGILRRTSIRATPRPALLPIRPATTGRRAARGRSMTGAAMRATMDTQQCIKLLKRMRRITYDG